MILKILRALLVLFIILGIFSLGFLAALLFINKGVYNPQTPSDYINESKIHVNQSSVCIDIENPSLSRYANSGSMRQVLDENSNGIRIPINQSNISVGDIITYHDSKDLVVHRVIDIKRIGNETFFLIKGDSNNLPDGWINENKILYKTIMIIY